MSGRIAYLAGSTISRCISVRSATFFGQPNQTYSTNPWTSTPYVQTSCFHSTHVHRDDEHLRLEPTTFNHTQIRHKSGDKRGRRKVNAEDNDDDDDDNALAEFADLQGGKDNKVAAVKVSSLRTDLLIKSGMGLARNKVEAAFYDSRIRVNGRKMAKKSMPIKIGDEIDVIKDVSPVNPDHLVVARVEVLSVQPNADDITVVLRRFKTLTIENYEAGNVWRQQSTE